jgi:hypothetical protein
MATKVIIGRVEEVLFPHLGIGHVHARIDTGAQTTAIWASRVGLEQGRLAVVFLGPEHRSYTGETVYFDHFEETIVASSNGHTELRYKVRTTIHIAGRKIRARLTLADRSSQVYPVLVGRNVLRGKFIVDVSEGTPLKDEEKQRSVKLQSTRKGR